MLRTTSFVLALALTAQLPPSSASACSLIEPPATPLPPPPPDHTDLPWGIAIAAGAVVDATFVGLQIGYADQMFPTWLAALELTLGIGQTLFGAGLFAASFVGSLRDDSCEARPTWPRDGFTSSFLLMGVGGWLIAHAIWSLADGDESTESSARLRPIFTASPDGALVGVIGTF